MTRVGGLCFFAGREIVGGHAPDFCWGPLHRCHVIPKPWIAKALPAGLTVVEATRIIWDDRIWLPGCWGHHQAFDHFRIELARAELPAVAEEYAGEHGVLHLLDRRYGARETAA